MGRVANLDEMQHAGTGKVFCDDEATGVAGGSGAKCRCAVKRQENKSIAKGASLRSAYTSRGLPSRPIPGPSRHSLGQPTAAERLLPTLVYCVRALRSLLAHQPKASTVRSRTQGNRHSGATGPARRHHLHLKTTNPTPFFFSWCDLLIDAAAGSADQMRLPRPGSLCHFSSFQPWTGKSCATALGNSQTSLIIIFAAEVLAPDTWVKWAILCLQLEASLS